MKSMRYLSIQFFAFFLAILIVSSCFASTPFNSTKSATREQALQNFLNATYGGYGHTGGGNWIPFFPKGFPSWNMTVSQVKELLGEPTSTGRASSLSTLNYGRFEIIVKDNKMVGVKCDIYWHKYLIDYMAKVTGWTLKSKLPDSTQYEGAKEMDPSELVYGTRFATSRSRSPRFSVIAWLIEDGYERGSYVALQDIARELGAEW